MHPTFESLGFFLFGMSGWWVYNALSAEQPIFTACNDSGGGGGGGHGNHTDVFGVIGHGGSQISVVSQLGNIVPLLYRVIVKYCCASPEHSPSQRARLPCTCARSLRVPVAILVLLATGLLAALLAANYGA